MTKGLVTEFIKWTKLRRPRVEEKFVNTSTANKCRARLTSHGKTIFYVGRTKQVPRSSIRVWFDPLGFQWK